VNCNKWEIRNAPGGYFTVHEKVSFLWWTWWSVHKHDVGCYDEGIVYRPIEFTSVESAMDYVKATFAPSK
jgi:hypothetical protein